MTSSGFFDERCLVDERAKEKLILRFKRDKPGLKI